jgi:hypothetical protein
MDKCVLGEFNGFVLNCEGNLFGGIQIWEFLRFYSGIHVESLRRGGIGVVLGEFGLGGGGVSCPGMRMGGLGSE